MSEKKKQTEEEKEKDEEEKKTYLTNIRRFDPDEWGDRALGEEEKDEENPKD